MGNLAVIGSGPVGLAVADAAIQAGFRTFMIDSRDCRSTHNAAAAFWTPFCSGLSDSDANKISSATLEFYYDTLSRIPNATCGLSVRKLKMYHARDTFMNPAWLAKPRLRFRRPSIKNTNYPIPRNAFTTHYQADSIEVSNVAEYETVVIEPFTFLPWYLNQLVGRGLEVIDFALPVRTTGDGYQQIESFVSQKEISVLVYCTGMFGLHEERFRNGLRIGDSLDPQKGVIAFLKEQPAEEDQILLYEGGPFDKDPLYWVPQVNRIALGGTVHSVALDFSEDSWEVSAREKLQILTRAFCFLPPSHKSILKRFGLNEDPNKCLENENVTWVAGVRPLNNGGPIIKKSEFLTDICTTGSHRTDVYVCTGHGGSGFTLCQDSAKTVLDLIVHK